MSELGNKDIKSFSSNEEKMEYARKAINCLPGFSPADDHAILICERYRSLRKKNQNEKSKQNYTSHL